MASPPATARFADRCAVVTGAASGIGLAVSRRLAREGACVVLGDISERRGEAAEAALRAEGLEVCFQVHDAGDEASWEELRTRVAAAYGRLDVLVNNAYSGRAGSVLTLTPAALREGLRVNAEGVLLGLQTADALMREGGAVVNIASIAALSTAAENVAYAIGKSAALQLTRAAAMTLARRTPPIRVNAVAPGSVDTHALRATLRALAPEDPEAARAELTRNIPMGRIADAEEIAATVAFLASSDASYMTGACLVADGGAIL